MNVEQLVAFLKTQPQDLQVIFECYSEFRLLEEGEILVREASIARQDGWVHSKRPDKPSQVYLVFPGN